MIGIGETREERLDALLALRALGEEFGHVQEVIVQNFRAKPGTRMASHPEPSLDDHLWTIAAARLLLGPAEGPEGVLRLDAHDSAVTDGEEAHGGTLGPARESGGDRGPNAL